LHRWVGNDLVHRVVRVDLDNPGRFSDPSTERIVPHLQLLVGLKSLVLLERVPKGKVKEIQAALPFCTIMFTDVFFGGFPLAGWTACLTSVQG
jgi:hypothetical protein